MGGEASKSGDQAAARQVDHRFDFFLSKVAKQDELGSEILKPAFVSQFPDFAENLAENFFNHVALINVSPEEQPTKSLDDVSRQQCYEAFLQVQSLTSTQSQLQFYIKVFCGRNGLTEKGVYLLLETAYIISMRANGTFHKWTEIEQTVIKELAHTIVSRGSQASASSWMDTNCPNLITAMHHFFLSNIYRGKEEAQNTNLTNSEMFEGRLLSMTRWWMLTSALPSCFSQSQGQSSEQVDGASANGDQNQEVAEEYQWDMLYSSQDHGQSLNRFKHHVFGYRGPTVLMLSCDGDYVYAVAIDVEWREGIQPWGGANCHIIRISPNFQILEDGDNMIVFNDKSRNIPKGVWIGRDSRNRKLHIEEGFETVTHNFQTSHIKCMEVWGCGDPNAKAAQSKQKKTELRDAEKRAKVKLPGHWDDNPDKMILEWGGVKVNHAEYAYDAKK